MNRCWRGVQIVEQPVEPIPPVPRLAASRSAGDYPAAADRTARGATSATTRRYLTVV
ncbi:MAG TPA: hypothetical protein VKB62_04400 [Streptosporangiaceae bacterium]|nr:hypothetical protein [Streptosporangiaceae bacterium]